MELDCASVSSSNSVGTDVSENELERLKLDIDKRAEEDDDAER